MIAYDDFAKVEMRVGRVVRVEDFERARKPSYKVEIDFGPEIGRKRSSLQAKPCYSPEELLGRLVICVVNLQPKNIAGFSSEVLVLAVPDETGSPSLLAPVRPALLGGRVY